MQNVGLMGRAGAGKDSVAALLGETLGYQRVAIADPIREAALRLNPIVSAEGDYRLADIVGELGWEHAKRELPEVRRILQEMGQGVLQYAPSVWLDIAMRRADTVSEYSTPTVITDVRYPFEATVLRARGWLLVWIDRDVPQLAHPSEHAVGPGDADVRLANCGSLGDLALSVRALADSFLT